MRCASCESDRIEPHGPDAYRCSNCDYWGGPGALRAARIAAGDSWDERKARRAAFDDLVQARLMLIGLTGADAEALAAVPALDRRRAGLGLVVVTTIAAFDGFTDSGGSELGGDSTADRQGTVESTTDLVKSAWRRLKLPQATLDRALAPRGLVERIVSMVGLGHVRVPRLLAAVDEAILAIGHEFERTTKP